MKEINLFDNQITLNISEEHWEYLCKYRFFSEQPAIEEIQAEFVTGTGITRNKPLLWEYANTRFSEYVEDLKEIKCYI